LPGISRSAGQPGYNADERANWGQIYLIDTAQTAGEVVAARLDNDL